ncbi:3-dehydroquinate dehydratase [Bryocella elongata]|uniref:Multifunctional fusion protein n=1 Tax=Bryocella elongata TaxID=863522 RepID=A0A1H6C8Z7_9BACT|nr:shikimate dehydrogenase [Bryocella elongata]SEG69450.1 3-dehydroquinate dehydratase [Bryocella elongata]
MTNELQIASHLLRSRIGKICAAILGSNAEEMLTRASEVLQDTSFIEFRLDYLSKPAAALTTIGEFLASNGAITAIATCRPKEFGGQFDGSSKASLDILLAAAEAGFQVVDVDIDSLEKLPGDTMSRLRATGAGVIISWHDFHETKDLDAVAKRIQAFEPDFMKVVPTARNLADNLVLMDFIKRWEDQTNAEIVGICMGEAGTISRILSLRAGSAFTFAAATKGEETAPGQLSARSLVETYRIDTVDAATKVFGVAGNPIGSSMSPLMLNTAFRRETVNAVYLALQTSNAQDLFKLVKEIPLQGLSVTMPLKQDVIPFLERTDALSTKIGAVNTISRMADGKWYGFNTDVHGIVGPLEKRMSLKGAKVLVLGAGGAARAAVFGCRDKGAEVWILNRTPETAAKLAKQSGAKVIKREAVAKTGFDVIINATPVGMNGNKSPQLLGPEDLTAKLVFDTVYNPLETPLLRMARQKGIHVITGIEMFVQQGARQFEIWTGKPAPEEEMLRVVLHALRQAAEAAGEVAAPALAPASRIQTAAAEAAAPPPPPPAPAPVEPVKPVAVKAAAKPAPVKAAAPAPAKAPVPPAAPAKAAPPKTGVNGSKPAAKVEAKPAPAKPVAAAKVAPKVPTKVTTKITATVTKKAAPAAKAVAKKPVVAKPVAKAIAKPLAKAKPAAKAKPTVKAKAKAR